jgi:hypothetical protein
LTTGFSLPVSSIYTSLPETEKGCPAVAEGGTTRYNLVSYSGGAVGVGAETLIT